MKTFLCLFLLTLASLVQAQMAEEEAPEWYQVEVVIFEYLARDQAGDPETWPKDIELNYPDNRQKLITPDEAAEMISILQLDTGKTFPPVLELDSGPELAFVKLPEEERTLNQTTGGIARRQAMRILFHEAWRQPALSAQEAPAIIIKGGNSYGEHTELEGSIRLSVSRYLHVYTDFWLTQFTPNYGQKSEHWPPLPPVPQRQEEEAYTPTPTPTPTSTPTSTPTPTSANGAMDLAEDELLWQAEVPLMEDYTSLINQPFLITQILTLKQARRMRSGELHYIDHPRLGMLIKVENYEPKAEEANEES